MTINFFNRFVRCKMKANLLLHRLYAHRLSRISRRWLMKHHLSEPLSNHPDKIRNIGIIAHIDAGKTTLTEQLLFLTGSISTIGEVDDGSTVTDFMDLERERGITIQSAAVSSNWRDHRINLIDTPGHVDFTMEVERSLRVLDGSVTVLDASAGVQAQTLTVWRQARKFAIPSIFFVNKMDKPNADFSHSITSIEDRLNSKICTLVLPVFSNNGQRTLESFVDVISRKYLIFERFSKENQKFVRNKGALKWIDVQKNTHYEEIFLSGMEDLVISLADVDKDFEKELVGMPTYAGIPLEKLTEVIRRNTLANKVHPLACGSALHSNASVCPLLDMVVDFLPSPEERKHPISPEADVCAFVFKVRHDKRRGQLNYVRIYRGKIQPSQPNRRTLVNANTGEHQTNFQLFAPFSDLLQPIDTIDEGNIAVITGLKNTKTGDTLVNCTHMKHKSSREGHVDFETLASSSKNIPIKNIGHLALEGIETPPPVFSCIIEPPNAASEIEFRRILAEFAVEDPSFRAKEDEDTGQIIIEGMGELHIEVVRERLLREHGMNAFFGPLQVNYKEVPQKSVECSERMEDVQNKKQWCSLRLRVEPMTDAKEGAMVESFKEVVIQLDSDSVELSEVDRAHRLLIQYPDYQKAINDGCLVAVHNGPLSGYPVANLRILLREFSCSNSKLHPTLLSACANKCLTRALKMADLQMREPIMRMEVLLLPNKLGEISNPDPIIRELLNRRATILDVSMDSEKGRNTIVRATIPLVETQGFSRTIRSLSSGMANFHLQPIGYFPVETEFVRTNI